MNAKYIIGGIIVISFMAWGASSFLETAVRYVPIAEAKGTRSQVQVMGQIDFSTVSYDTSGNSLRFTIRELEEEGKPVSSELLPIVYHGVVPGNFDQAKSVVVRGKFDGAAFHADKMLVKCPSKYQGEGEYQNMEKHNEGVKALEGA